LTSPTHIIRKNSELPELYHALAAGDIIACRLSLKYEEEHLLLDLLERGVHLIPSATSQLASRSKTFQARLLAPYMVPHTTAIYDIHGLLNTISLYGHHDVGKVVLKHDRKNAGLGINLYGSIEDIYNQATNNSISYPFVVQPFVPDSRDIRVIILGDYTEAYERRNPDNFRNNLHCGGAARPFQLNTDQIELCEKIMTRASFPYGHLDLMVTEENEIYLAEINLRGGIRGAVIDPASYQKKVKAVEEKLLQEIV
jgi:ribosomal protein S6--L-glutamate ligase